MVPAPLVRGLAALAALALSVPALTAPASAQSVPYEGPNHISGAAIAANAEAFAHQATAEEWKRTATQTQDWTYTLADGVTTRQVSFYVDGGTRLQGKLFMPKGFSTARTRPAIVVGHGINALAIGIEKYAARFAERGFVALSIDYQSYGFSDSGADELLLLAPDPTAGTATPTTTIRLPVRIKRTNLNNVEEVKAFRGAVSFLQGEPGVDPGRIGTWASSNGGAVTAGLLGADGRVKASVIHVMGVAPAAQRAFPLSGDALDDAIVRVQTGQGAETTAGFSFPTNVDLWYRSRSRDVQPGASLHNVRPGTAVLFLAAEKDELIGGNRSAVAGASFLNEKGAPSQVITFPGLTHFQPYSGTGFEVGSTLAADWFDKFLGGEK